MKAAFYVTEAAIVVAGAGGLALGAGWAADWLASGLLHPVAAAVPAGVALRCSRGRRPLETVERWHGTAVRRLDGRG
jgi:hypothetical protein